MNKTRVISIILIILSILVGIYFYNIFPDRLASHWNAAGEVNGYMSKFWGLFLVPIIMAGLFLLFLVIPSIDPRKENIKKFKKQYDLFVSLLLGFMFYIYLLTIFWNLGYKFNMVALMIPAFAVLFFYISVLLKHAKRNFFIGIRTPWTLSNDKVWDKTHKLGSQLFKVSAIISLVGIVFPTLAIYFILVPIFASALFLVIYSYVIFPKDK